MTDRFVPILLSLFILAAAAPALADRGDDDDDRCSPDRVVYDLLASVHQRDVNASLKYLAPNVVYINLGLAKVVGRSGVAAFLGPLVSFFSDIDLVDPTDLEIIHKGKLVMTKRLEHYTVSPTSPIGNRGASFDLPVMGRFVVEKCLITSWVDYFSLEIFNAGSGFNLPPDLTAVP